MAKNFKFKCPNCGKVGDFDPVDVCPHCKNPINIAFEGTIQLYRMGNPIGCAVGYGIYIDGEPMGHIANTESAIIPVKFGTHTLKCTCGMTRKCQELTFTVTPEAPSVFAKAHIVPGFWQNKIVIELADAASMPPLN